MSVGRVLSSLYSGLPRYSVPTFTPEAPNLMSAPEGYAVPRSLEIKPRFLFWSAEHVIITCSLMIIGGIIDHLILGTLAGILTASWWSRISAKQSSGFALHLGYWYVDGLKLERTPPSAMRRFVG